MQKISTQLTAKKSKIALYSTVLGAALLSTMLNSCSRSKINDPIGPVPTIVEFVPTSTGTYTAGYFIKTNNAPYALAIGYSTKSDVDRTIGISVTSKTAVVGTQYTTPPTSVTIKAGSAQDSIRIGGLFAGFPLGRKDTIVIKMTNTNGVATPDGNTTFKIVAQQYCDVIAANLVGNYVNSHDYYPSVVSAANDQGQYTAVLSAWTPTAGSSTKASVNMKNIGGSYFGPFLPTDAVVTTGITAALDWTDPANFTLAIAKQSYCVIGSYGASTVTGTGSWSSCDKSFTMKLTAAVSAGTFTPPLTVLKQ